MRIEKVRINDKLVMPFTNPSGTIATDALGTARMFSLISLLGIWTTKSTGVNERVVPSFDETLNPVLGREYGLREPIFAQVDFDTYVNAVRLTNPGIDKTREHIKQSKFPIDKAINLSVFGGTIDEIVTVIKGLEDIVDCFEINGSCPHSEKGGMIIGIDPKSVYEFTKAAVTATDKPILFKLTPNTSNENIKAMTRAVYEAGGKGVVLTNTVGPYIHTIDGHPILTSKIGGGKSGRGIRDRGIECVMNARLEVQDEKFIIFGMGGIGTSADVISYSNAGANIFGIGTRLIGMTENEISEFYTTLFLDLENGTNNSERLLKHPDMSYKKVRVKEIANNNCDFKVYRTDVSIDAEAGQFVFAWIPGVGEKPFSIMDNDPLTLGVLSRGYFTKQFNSLQVGDSFYYRGPHGRGVNVPKGSEVVLVGGGCGIAGLYLLAKQLSKDSDVTSILGAKDKEHLPYMEEFRKFGSVLAATEDGSYGMKGTVYNRMCHHANHEDIDDGSYFFNCGPRAMVEAVLPIELAISSHERVFTSVDEITRCGVGVCGSCVDYKGLRTCVEGPFMNW